MFYNLGALHASVRFDFVDGSGFTVITKLIQNNTDEYNSYYQYPTTFHDVKFNDGSKSKFVSEELMNTKF